MLCLSSRLFVRTWFRLFLALAALFAAAAHAELSPTMHVRVPMTDGTELATDIYLPQGNGPWPVILLRTTYGRYFPMEHFLRGGYVEDGYVGIIQDLRGMGNSAGEPHVFYADGWRPGLSDGADTIAWILKQPWCSGKVGAYGQSALGMAAMLLAPATHDVAAQAIFEAPASFYHHAAYQGGVFVKNLVEGWLTAMFQPYLIPIYKAQPSDNPFWDPYNTLLKIENVTAPAVFYGGWYDIFQQGILDAFAARETNGGPGAKGKNYLIMNWGPHQSPPKLDFRPKAKNDQPVSRPRLTRLFFDYYLKGFPDALDGVPKVQYFVMGDDTDRAAPGNEWRTAESWPPYPTVETPFFLQNDGMLANVKPVAADAACAFTFDPANPFPTCGGANLFFNTPIGPQDQRSCGEGREDLLKFATAPLTEPVEVAGRVTVRLYVSSDAPDTDFTAKLLDIYPEPDGRELNILDSVRRVKYRETLRQPLPPLTGPDQVVQLDIDLWSTCIVFNKGHRIGLHISSSNYPRFEINPNTGADYPEKDAPMRTARNQVHCSQTYPSALVLPTRAMQ